MIFLAKKNHHGWKAWPKLCSQALCKLWLTQFPKHERKVKTKFQNYFIRFFVDFWRKILIVDRDCQGLKNMLISKISKYHGLLYACPYITRLCHYTNHARLLEMGTSDEPLPSLPKVLFGFKFSQRYMNFISKKHFNFERKEGRKEGHEHHHQVQIMPTLDNMW